MIAPGSLGAILVVDDEEIMREILDTLLTREGYRVHLAATAADGLDLANPYVTPIGPACAICPRVRCPQRAEAPAGMTLSVNETRKTISPFPFLGG